MGDAIFISICIPAYRRVDFLNRLLDSISAQSYRHFEVVITDDSPGTEVHHLVQNHAIRALIRYFKNEPALGTPENWNESIRRAKGEWIKLMHDDDWFKDSESLAAYVRGVQSRPASFYFSAYENVFPDGKAKPVWAGSAFVRRLNRFPEVLLAANRIGPPSAVLFKNDPELIFDSRLRWLVDIDFYMRYLKAHPGPVYLPSSLVCIGISESQVTQTSFGNREVEIPERFLVWEKMPPKSIQHLQIYDSWWRFVRNMKIRSTKEILAVGYHGQAPIFITSMIRFQKKIPDSVLRTGVVSKLLMMYLFFATGFFKASGFFSLFTRFNR